MIAVNATLHKYAMDGTSDAALVDGSSLHLHMERTHIPMMTRQMPWALSSTRTPCISMQPPTSASWSAVYRGVCTGQPQGGSVCVRADAHRVIHAPALPLQVHRRWTLHPSVPSAFVEEDCIALSMRTRITQLGRWDQSTVHRPIHL